VTWLIAAAAVGLWAWLVWKVWVRGDFFGDEGHPDEWEHRNRRELERPDRPW
jgi:hypothetical protein